MLCVRGSTSVITTSIINKPSQQASSSHNNTTQMRCLHLLGPSPLLLLLSRVCIQKEQSSCCCNAGRWTPRTRPLETCALQSLAQKAGSRSIGPSQTPSLQYEGCGAEDTSRFLATTEHGKQPLSLCPSKEDTLCVSVCVDTRQHSVHTASAKRYIGTTRTHTQATRLQNKTVLLLAASYPQPAHAA